MPDLWKPVFTLVPVSVQAFNLLKHIVAVYIVGHLANAAYQSLIETKRYLALRADGHFCIAQWGSSRNNAFSGSMYEGLLGVNHNPELDNLMPLNKRDSQRSRAVRRVGREVTVIVLVLLLAACEAMSEFFTDSEERVLVTFGERNMTLRSNSSWVLMNDVTEFSDVTHRLLARRCGQYIVERNTSLQRAVRPNLIVTGAGFGGFHRVVPSYNLRLLCAYDRQDKSSWVDINRTDFKQNLDQVEGYVRGPDTSVSMVVHTYLAELVRDKILVPHFVEQRFHRLDESYEGGFPIATAKIDPDLALVRLDDNLYTCTYQYPWCVRPLNGGYELIFQAYGDRYNQSVDYSDPEFVGVWPIWISNESVPNMQRDRHMMRPKVLGNHLMDLEETMMMVGIGYNFGWAVQKSAPGNAIVTEKSRIVPTILLGYVIFQPMIIAFSLFAIFYNSILRRRRHIKYLTGERAFVEHWRAGSLYSQPRRLSLYSRQLADGEWVLDVAEPRRKCTEET